MANSATNLKFLEVLRKSGVIDEDRWKIFLRDHPDLPEDPQATTEKLIAEGLMTKFQAKHLLAGRYRGLTLGQYVLVDEIGKGGTGMVFLAEHIRLRRRAAIKVLPTDHVNYKETLERFYREARAVAALDHPNIIRAHDFNREGSIHYLVMEYIEGESLQKYVQRRGPLPFPEAASLVLQVACGLQHAHERGLIHRDIKPGNLLLDGNGTIKILDMGLALFFEETNDTLTRDLAKGAILGTADYLSPEQALNGHTVDIRSDIYSLGATFYTFLNGQPPFHDSNVTKKLIDHQMKNPPPLHQLRSDVPRGLADLVARMMAKKPEDRPQSPAELIELLQPWTRAESSQDTAASFAHAPARSHKKWLTAVAALAAVLILGVGVWWMMGRLE